MGEVFLAHDRRLDRRVALKVLSPPLNADADRVSRFLQEARAASALTHPNVAVIYDIGESEGISFIAMEYVEGHTLAEALLGEPMATRGIVDIASQVADALQSAHAKGVIHRDVKPANLMITAAGLVKVLDFGLAKMARSDDGPADENGTHLALTDPGIVMGTVAYMSPEQAIGAATDHRTDLFSLGVVLYQAATGRMPFAGSTNVDTIDRIRHAQPDAIARFNYAIPSDLERIIRKCLEKEPERRYQSARRTSGRPPEFRAGQRRTADCSSRAHSRPPQSARGPDQLRRTPRGGSPCLRAARILPVHHADWRGRLRQDQAGAAGREGCDQHLRPRRVVR